MKIVPAIAILLICTGFIFGQIDNNQEPPGIDWKTIDTKHFRLIFPEAISADARRVANTLEYEYSAITKTIDYQFDRVPVLLTTQSVIPNGYFAMAPRRSEWYGTPFQVGAFDGEWYNLLASHEIRHVVQAGKIVNRGFNRVLGILGGQELVWGITNLMVPRWFWEGDAVLTETLLSKSGRGRDPGFDIGARALLLSGKEYAYYKAMLGSYKDFYSDHYTLGYLLVAHVRKNHDKMAWSHILGRTSFFTFYPFAFAACSKGIIGKGATEIYEAAMQEWKTLWREQQDSLMVSKVRQINKAQDVYTNYYFPQSDASGSIIAMKQGLADTRKLVSIDREGKEELLTRLGGFFTVAVNAGKATWSQLSVHPRWQKQTFADIMLFDLKTKQKRLITKRGKFFTPALSKDGKKIAAVRFTPNRQCRLVIFDVETAEIARVLPNPENDFIKEPDWSEDGKKLVFTRQNANGKALTIYDFESDRLRNVIPYCWQGITAPVFYKNYILFGSFYSGIDNIYAVDIKTGQPWQVTSRPYGACNPSVDFKRNTLLFNDYSIKGYNAVAMPLDTTQWTKSENVPDRTIKYYESLISQEQGRNIFDPADIPDKKYEIKSYNSFKNLFNLHSWYISPDSLNLGIGIKSTDLLNTAEMIYALYYNKNERSLGGMAQFSYGGFWPIIDVVAERRARAQTFQNSTGQKWDDYWWENSAGLAMRLPLNFSRGIYSQFLQFSLSAQVYHISGQEPFTRDYFNRKGEKGEGWFYPVTCGFLYQSTRRHVARDVMPRFGNAIGIAYKHTPFAGDYLGESIFASARLYLPGLMRHHAIRIAGNYETQRTGGYRFASEMIYPRGYSYDFYEQFYKVSADYGLPLLYPDLDLGKWFYLKRIKGMLFYDYGVGLKEGKRKYHRSLGFELLLDHHWLSFWIEFEGGYRYACRIEDREVRHEILFRIPM